MHRTERVKFTASSYTCLLGNCFLASSFFIRNEGTKKDTQIIPRLKKPLIRYMY